MKTRNQLSIDIKTCESKVYGFHFKLKLVQLHKICTLLDIFIFFNLKSTKFTKNRYDKKAGGTFKCFWIKFSPSQKYFSPRFRQKNTLIDFKHT